MVTFVLASIVELRDGAPDALASFAIGKMGNLMELLFFSFSSMFEGIRLWQAWQQGRVGNSIIVFVSTTSHVR
jgi:hypothetical protein